MDKHEKQFKKVEEIKKLYDFTYGRMKKDLEIKEGVSLSVKNLNG
jgi:hypothetical protein